MCLQVNSLIYIRGIQHILNVVGFLQVQGSIRVHIVKIGNYIIKKRRHRIYKINEKF